MLSPELNVTQRLTRDPARAAAIAYFSRIACGACSSMPDDRACLSHTCPDCGHVTYLASHIERGEGCTSRA